MVTVNLKSLFNNEKILIDAIELEPCSLYEHIPVLDKNYVFELNVLNEILLLLAHPQHDCLYISGPSGCGKTTIMLQIASRLNWPVEQITLSNKSESIDLIGHATLRKGELVFEYGPLTRAMMYGEILILNEIDLMSPGDLSVLNDVLEGKPLTILANNGEIIHPHPQFRVVATANTKGFGDMTGFYNGARLLNQAFLDRFRYLEMSYPKANVECLMIKQAYPNLDDALISNLVRFANELRQVVNMGLENGVRQLSAPFSTRTLLKIAGIAALDLNLTMHKIISMTFALRLPKVEFEYVMRLCNDVFGHEKEVLANTSKNNLNDSIKVQDEMYVKDDKDTTAKGKKTRKVKKTNENLEIELSA